MKKNGLFLAGMLIFLLIFLSGCTTAPPSQGGSFLGISSLGEFFEKVGNVTGTKLLNNEVALEGFLRICIFLLIFILLFEGGKFMPIWRDPANRRSLIVIALVIAIASSIFVPRSVLAAIFSSYAIVASTIFIGIPIVALLWLCYGVLPNHLEGRILHGARLILLLIVLFLLINVKNWALKLINL